MSPIIQKLSVVDTRSMRRCASSSLKPACLSVSSQIAADSSSAGTAALSGPNSLPPPKTVTHRCSRLRP